MEWIVASASKPKIKVVIYGYILYVLISDGFGDWPDSMRLLHVEYTLYEYLFGF
jgi:hypothetical protein